MGAAELDPSPLADVVADFTAFDSTPAELVPERIDGVDFVFANKARMTKEIISNTGNLRFIGLTATGVDNVDLEAAKKHDVAVCNIRAYCTQSIVEHVFSVLINLSTTSVNTIESSVPVHGSKQTTLACSNFQFANSLQ